MGTIAPVGAPLARRDPAYIYMDTYVYISKSYI